jgi:predicted nucleotidyltransferase
MTYIYSHEMQIQLKDSLELLKMILGPDLLGVYLYGSSLLGGLQKYSDIDLFVVTNRATTSEEKTRLVASLLQISGIYMKSSKLPIEMTLVEKSAINPWKYPPFFDFQYGDWLRTSFEKGIIEPWQTYEMPDLALIVTQVLLKSQTLWGLEPEQLLVPVPYHDFMKAMLHDLNRLASDLEHDTRNVLLTYARIWSTLETNAIRSKPAAADWVMNHLPKIYQPVMKRAKSICIGVENEFWEDIKVLIKSCADFMVDKINMQISLVNFDDPNKSIKLVLIPENSYHPR